MGNSKSKDPNVLWKKKQDYYNNIANETQTHVRETGVFGRKPSQQMRRLSETLGSMASNDSFISSRNRKSKNFQEIEQSRSWWSWWMPSSKENFNDRPFHEQLKDKGWLNDLIKGLTKYSKLQEGFKEIARFVKTNKALLNEK